MKQLRIGWQGTSRALAAVRQVLEQYGHIASDDAVDLMIEDGSRHLPSLITAIPCMRLRVGVGPVADDGLPALELRCYDRDRRLWATQGIAREPEGNGQRLCQMATNTLTDWVAMLVSSFARDPGCFTGSATASDFAEWGLLELDALAYLHRFNRTADPTLLRQARVPIIERLQACLTTFAERTALNISGSTVSYRQLLDHALAIQAQLHPLLEQTETLPVVGVCLEKSTALYASILAVLGCGAVYLPLAPDHPSKRHQLMLDGAKARVLLDDGKHPLRSQFSSLDVSMAGPGSIDPAHSLMRHRPAMDAPCMVLYTSGTTGRPKGVMLSQSNLAHFTAWFGACMALDEQSRVLQFSSLSFDASLIDIFPSLMAGAELIIPSEEQRRDPLALVDLIHQQHISHAFLPPAVLSTLPADQPLGLQHLFTGGDACEPSVIERLAGECQLHNLYGPTEATVLVTHRVMQPGTGNRNLGLPVANSQVLILDDQMRPVDEQVMGELYIVGPGVSLGYITRTEQACDAFVDLALPGRQPLRAYRTGDLAKWTDDGIELGGRRDQQVKIRGYRVEPQEIEQCLRDSGLFRQVAVVIDHNHRIGCFVTQPEPGATVALLEQHARQRLPDYMLPRLWRELPSLPHSCNGKVDRQALLALPCIPGGVSGGVQTPLQSRLILLWSELLDLSTDRLSVDESFFNLGGHSILLSMLLLRARKEFGRSFALSRFIEEPTVRRLAMLLGDESTPLTHSGPAIRDAQREWVAPILGEDRRGDPRMIIVTGANSFVGVHIVQALLEGGATEMACLVRESPGHSAMARFTQALHEYRLQHLDHSRVQVYAADISLPQFGLTNRTYERLARDYGVLVHNAARVNHVMDYASLAQDNVEPIFECLHLCETGAKKVFNFVSTLSASSGVDVLGHVLEAPAAASPPLYIRNGYNLSKWAAERLLGRAVERGGWVNILRPGNVSFNSKNGVCQPQKNRLMLMLKGSLQLGLAPRLEGNFDLMPVDFLARFIAFHCARFDIDHRVFNLHNPQPLSWERYLDVFSQAGHRFERVSIQQWQDALRTVGPENALFGVLGFYLDRLEDDIGDTSRIRHDNAQRGVWQMGESYPEKNLALMNRGCRYLKHIGFL
ncbi:amino acid adenylation domain-containing protein [Pseudomonas sp. SDO524_S393]